MKLDAIQQQLQVEGLDGWLFFDHHVRDPIAYRVLGLEPGHVSRRWYYYIPAQGEPRKLVHRIEPRKLDSLPGTKQQYSAWPEQYSALQSLLQGAGRVAMQYSPNCMIPYVALVDAGTVELIRSLGIEVVSSAGLVQYFEARWTDEQYEMHLEAGRRVDQVRAEAFELIGTRLRQGGELREYDVAEFIRRRFRECGLYAADGPIVGVGPHSADPHYAPSDSQSSAIRAGDFVLIDLWAKLTAPQAVYYDVTWTGYCGAEPPDEIQAVFEVVTGARDAAVTFVREAMRAGRALRGCDLDDVVRGFITERGYGDAFVHRTGHSIGEEVHGNGANIDNLETNDQRPIIPRTCFSIEPGVYLQNFGVRSEIDCYVSDDDAGPTGEVQTEIVRVRC
jgi:Xaa-Pro aminopeptidase